MQFCMVTSRFPPFGGESRGAPVVKRRSDGFAYARLVPSRETLPRTGSLCSRPPDTRRSGDEPFYGLQEAFAPWARGASDLPHRTMIGGPTKNTSGSQKQREATF